MKKQIQKIILGSVLLGTVMTPLVSFAETTYTPEQQADCKKEHGTKCEDVADFGFTSQESMDKALDEAAAKDANKLRMASGQGFKLPLDFLTLETKDKSGKTQKQGQAIFNNKDYGQYGPLLGTFLRVIDILIYIIGSVAMLTLVVAGIFMIANHGDEAWVSKAKGMMLYSILGVIFALLSFAVVNVVQSILS